MLKRIFIFLMLVSSVIPAISQEGILNYFNANSTGNSVLLTWEIKGGNTCNGIKIFRSSDGISFQQIGQVDGLCGSTDFAVAYSYNDESPEKNKWNYYKIELVNSGFSEVSKAYFLDNLTSFSITQDYSASQLTVIFSNPQFDDCVLTIFTIDGKKLHSLSSSSDRFIIDYRALKVGIVAFMIQRPGREAISGRMYFN